jgi:uncharacterized protein YuzE
MKATIDRDDNAAYIYTGKTSMPTQPVTTYACDPLQTGMVNLDFDADGHLYGIEILGAKVKLHKNWSPRLSINGEAGVAFIHLDAVGASTEERRIYTCEPEKVGGRIDVVFDKNDKIIGLRVFDAARLLPPEATAEY